MFAEVVFFFPDFKDKSNVHVDGKLCATGSLSLSLSVTRGLES